MMLMTSASTIRFKILIFMVLLLVTRARKPNVVLILLSPVWFHVDYPFTQKLC